MLDKINYNKNNKFIQLKLIKINKMKEVINLNRKIIFLYILASIFKIFPNKINTINEILKNESSSFNEDINYIEVTSEKIIFLLIQYQRLIILYIIISQILIILIISLIFKLIVIAKV